jgi:hypothetical protein
LASFLPFGLPLSAGLTVFSNASGGLMANGHISGSNKFLREHGAAFKGTTNLRTVYGLHSASRGIVHALHTVDLLQLEEKVNSMQGAPLLERFIFEYLYISDQIYIQTG